MAPNAAGFASIPGRGADARPLTKAECDKIGYPHGSELVGHRLSTGQVMWLVYRPATGGEESPEAIAAVVAQCPAIGRTAGEAAVFAGPSPQAMSSASESGTRDTLKPGTPNTPLTPMTTVVQPGGNGSASAAPPPPTTGP